jgi:hypothetical protein
MRKILLVGFLMALLLSGCNSDKETRECVDAPDANEHVPIDIEQLQDALVNVRSKAELVDILTQQPMVRDYIFRRSEYSDDSVFINSLYSRFQNPGFDTLVMDTKKVFGDLSALEKEFEEAFSNMKAYYPDFKPPKIKAVVSGLMDNDLLVSDSLIIVSLDFYLGPTARFRPQVYDYQLRKFEPEDIVPACMLIYGIGEQLNKTDLADKTVLADMIAYGKSFYFAKHMIPCVPDSTLIWYTAEEINGARKNHHLIWARFIQDKVIYSTSSIEKRNYLGERPVTIQVGEKCPGRIGQWIGWQIVKDYMKAHPETTLPELMQMSDAQKIFRESRYKPKGM